MMNKFACDEYRIYYIKMLILITFLLHLGKDGGEWSITAHDIAVRVRLGGVYIAGITGSQGVS